MSNDQFPESDNPDNPNGDAERKGRGRPSTGDAKTGAERQKELRERKKAEGLVQLTVFLSEEVVIALDNFVRFKDLKKDDVVERCIRREVMRKR